MPGAAPPAAVGVPATAVPTLPPGTITPGTIPYAAPGPGAVAPAPGATTFGPTPMATLNGTIQPPPAAWDPYAPPGTGSSALLSQDPYFSGQFQMPSMAQVQKFVRDVELDYHWFAGHGSSPNQLGINDIDMSVSFNFPIFPAFQAPLVVSPGFTFNFWDGPKSIPTASTGVPAADMPPQTFDAYIDTKWEPKFNPILGAEMDVRVGVDSDFRRVTTESLRITGKGLAVLTFSPSIKIKAGVWYLDRVRVKILPAGGIVWSPNPDLRFDILFPNPRITQRITTYGNTEWWWYFSADYGGGVWTIKRAAIPGVSDPRVAGTVDLVDYNDIRIALGLEFHRVGGVLTGWFEGGYAFDRELVYSSHIPQSYKADNAFFLRTGFMF